MSHNMTGAEITALLKAKAGSNSMQSIVVWIPLLPDMRPLPFHVPFDKESAIFKQISGLAEGNPEKLFQFRCDDGETAIWLGMRDEWLPQ